MTTPKDNEPFRWPLPGESVQIERRQGDRRATANKPKLPEDGTMYQRTVLAESVHNIEVAFTEYRMASMKREALLKDALKEAYNRLFATHPYLLDVQKEQVNRTLERLAEVLRS